MSEVKRYDLVGDMDGNCNLNEARMELSDDGVYVKHSDYGALQAKCAALAAENAGLKSGAMDEIKVINRGGQAYCVKDGVQVNPMYARGWNDYRAKSLQSDTTATDAFLAEIENKAIRRFINSIEHILRDRLSPYDTEEMLEAMRIFLEEQSGEQK
ncbi:hypothetical protein KGB37_gp49 [Escherichia phage vB_EcoS Sa179lw]|uniref:Uncharacterized protein n=1 Tax=Escherichia phage vB_EcoS Sa179lw TaxID=2126819 RepID=A0A2P1MXC5_9CAUD|nr:hypothetical protein KGB37_gp49 [Escherichia phage vB_EcoS Sa179lw]AVP40234.1 hypothetical protein vBEcoSSa179w3YLVW_00049 [Escherichia phage vB_EcoS Sa179lw]